MLKRLSCLKKPPRWVLIILYPLTLCLLLASVWLIFADRTKPPFAALSVICWVLAALALLCSVYAFLVYAYDLKAWVLKKLHRHRFLTHIIEDYGFRTLIFAAATLAINIGYALFHGVLAFVSMSFWYAALCSYYIFLIAMRGIILFYQRQRARRAAEGCDCCGESARELERYRFCGILLIILPVSLLFSIVQMVAQGRGYSYRGLVIYVVAAYTAFKVINAIYNIFKARRARNMSVLALRNIGLADAMVSILALQTALLAVLGGNAGLTNAITGGAVCLLTALLGATMLMRATRADRHFAKENNPQEGEK